MADALTPQHRSGGLHGSLKQSRITHEADENSGQKLSPDVSALETR
jgi:hypothetical protein